MAKPLTAGWHNDPFDRAELRWFDGGRWTEHVSANSSLFADFVPLTAASGIWPAPSPPPPSSPNVPARRSAEPGRLQALRSTVTAKTQALFQEGKARSIAQLKGLSAPLRLTAPPPGILPRSYDFVPSGNSPRNQLIRIPQDAEDAACEWMRYWGFADARLTPDGADGGLDVIASDAVAQVKDQATPVGRPVIQQLVGAAEGRRAIFFARQGYTSEAEEWATRNMVALFRFDLQGLPETVNEPARRLQANAPRIDGVQYAGVLPEVGAVPLFSDEQLLRALRKHVRATDDQHAKLAAAFHAELCTYRLTIAYTARAGVGGLLNNRSAFTDVTLYAGRALDASHVVFRPLESLPPTFDEEWVPEIHEVAENFGEVWGRASFAKRSDPDRLLELEWLGLPSNTESAHLKGWHPYLRPFVIAVIDSVHGRRLAMLDAVTGQENASMSDTFTATWSTTESLIDYWGWVRLTI